MKAILLMNSNLSKKKSIAHVSFPCHLLSIPRSSTPSSRVLAMNTQAKQKKPLKVRIIFKERPLQEEDMLLLLKESAFAASEELLKKK